MEITPVDRMRALYEQREARIELAMRTGGSTEVPGIPFMAFASNESLWQREIENHGWLRRHETLRASAAAKLTDEERIAVGL
jgi:hypothetical protein